jgi:hypothetical protein
MSSLGLGVPVRDGMEAALAPLPLWTKSDSAPLRLFRSAATAKRDR